VFGAFSPHTRPTGGFFGYFYVFFDCFSSSSEVVAPRATAFFFFFFFFFPFSSSLPLYFGFAWISASVSSGFWVFFAGFWFVGFFGWVVRVLVSVLGVSPVFWVFYGVFYCILGFMWALGVVGV
jgi:hypothetical protein